MVPVPQPAGNCISVLKRPKQILYAQHPAYNIRAYAQCALKIFTHVLSFKKKHFYSDSYCDIYNAKHTYNFQHAT
jgi:hypothetical protein